MVQAAASERYGLEELATNIVVEYRVCNAD